MESKWRLTFVIHLILCLRLGNALDERADERSTIYGSLPTVGLFRHQFQYEADEISSNCIDDVRHLIDQNDTSNYTSNSPVSNWELEMLDSYGKLAPGLLAGNVFWMGDFAQCIALEVWRQTQKQDDAKPDFGGKYCLPNFNHYLPALTEMHRGQMPNIATFGICMPSSCKTTEVTTILNKYIRPLEARIIENQCHTREPTEIDGGTIVAFIPLVILGILMVLGTLFDIVPMIKMAAFTSKNPSESRPHSTVSILKAFSAYSNTKRLLDTSSKKNDELSCVNGIRAMSMLMVVTGHITLFMYVMNNGKHNPTDIAKIRAGLWTQPITHAPYSVETFFFLTAFLTTLLTMDRVVQTNQFPLSSFYIHRIWRLVPSMILLSALIAGPFQLTGNGPLWTSSPFYVTSVCQQSWWKNVLFLSVYFEDTSSLTTCMPHTWYLGVEMFFYVFSPIILYPLITKPSSGVLIWSGLFAMSFLFTGLAEYEVVKDATNSYQSFMVRRDQHKLVNIKPWCRMQTFLLGMLFGYIYHCHKRRSITLSKMTKTLMWIAVSITMYACVFGNYALQNGIAGAPARFEYFMDFTFSPSAWVICVGCIILACATGNGGVVNKILSWKFLVPIGRLSFSAYLLHFQVAAHFSLTRKQALYTHYPLLCYSWVAITAVTLLFAWIFSLLIESPASQLEGVLRKRGGSRRKLETNVEPGRLTVDTVLPKENISPGSLV